MEIKAYLAEAQGNEQITEHFKVKEFALKVLKVLKTRTALTRNGLAELRMRSARQGAKAPFKTKEQSKRAKEKLDNCKILWYNKS